MRSAGEHRLRGFHASPLDTRGTALGTTHRRARASPRAAERVSELLGIDMMATMTEFAEALRKELDYVNEARNAERL